MIALALNFFSVRIFPICPIDLGIIINVCAQDDNRKLHGVPALRGLDSISNDLAFVKCLTRWSAEMADSAWWMTFPWSVAG